MESTSKTQWRGKQNKSKFIWRFKPKSQNMQSITMTKKLAFQLKILILNQTQSIKTSKSIDLEKKKCAPIYVGLWPSTTNHSHSKPITTTRPRKRTQTLQRRSTTSPHNGAVARPRERESKDSNADPQQNPRTTTYPDHGIDAKTMWERREGWVTKKREGQESNGPFGLRGREGE